jgi:hypothetical protein
MKHFMDLSVSQPCIETTLEGDNVGHEMIKVLTVRRRMSAS